MIQDNLIRKYQDLYKEYFNKELSWEEARDGCGKLLLFIKTIYKPMTVEQMENIKARQKLLQEHYIESLAEYMQNKQ